MASVLLRFINFGWFLELEHFLWYLRALGVEVRVFIIMCTFLFFYLFIFFISPPPNRHCYQHHSHFGSFHLLMFTDISKTSKLYIESVIKKWERKKNLSSGKVIPTTLGFLLQVNKKHFMHHLYHIARKFLKYFFYFWLEDVSWQIICAPIISFQGVLRKSNHRKFGLNNYRTLLYQ